MNNVVELFEKSNIILVYNYYHQIVENNVVYIKLQPNNQDTAIDKDVRIF